MIDFVGAIPGAGVLLDPFGTQLVRGLLSEISFSDLRGSYLSARKSTGRQIFVFPPKRMPARNDEPWASAENNS